MNFYTLVIVLAIICLILLLTYIGIAMSKVTGNSRFSPHQNQCPDYWENDGNGFCIYPIRSGKNTGDFKKGTDSNNKEFYLTNTSDKITSSF
jgi:hypothetical protein